MAVKCPKCDSKNMDDGIYCVQCGTDLKVMRKDDPVVSSCPYSDADNTATAPSADCARRSWKSIV